MTDMISNVERENNELLQFLYACPVGLIQTDMTGSMTMLNPVAMQFLHRIGNASGSMNLFAALGSYAPELRLMVTSFPDDSGPICQGHRIHVGRLYGPLSGNPLVLACTIVKLGPSRLMATLEDVSERVAQEQRIKQADAWFVSFLNGANDFAVFALDDEGRIQAFDAMARHQTGFDERDLVGSHIQVLDSPDPASTSMGIAEEIDAARRDGWHLAEGWCSKRNGERYRCQRLISVRGETKADQRVAGYTVVLRPVSQGGMDADQLRRRLTTDHLTGACNRAHFFDLAEEEIRRCAKRGKAVGLICLDIDHFKSLNETHGHAVGDLVLKAVARACMDVLRPSDTFARLGGEEFTALLPSGDTSIMPELTERMRAAIAATSVKLGDLGELRVTASLGYVVRTASTVSITELVGLADQALYAAKRNGRNRVVESEALSAVA